MNTFLVQLSAMSPRYFFADGWNLFDFVIVALSIVELIFEVQFYCFIALINFSYLRKNNCLFLMVLF